MKPPPRPILVVGCAPAFAARLGAALAPAGHAVAACDWTAGPVRLREDIPAAAVACVAAPLQDPYADDLVTFLRAGGYTGLLVVLGRVQGAVGATHFLPRGVSPAALARYLRGLLKPTT
ncbi:MAG TPA: hypothetical protein VH482_20075 [Thermomicrobiales bacterium]|jgi:hypothetical protein